MLISKKEKQECKIKIEACQTTNELIDLVYDLYINHKYNYYNLRTVLRQVYPNCETKDVSNLFNDLNVKRCANNENCIDLKGPIKTREEFSINTSTMDGRNTISRLCERYKKFHRKLDDESKYNIELYHSFKTQEERDDCIIQLYSSLKYTFNELLNITLLDGDYLRA